VRHGWKIRLFREEAQVLRWYLAWWCLRSRTARRV
jgi:hypothetical protein